MKKKKLLTVVTILLVVFGLGGVYAYQEFNRKTASTFDLTPEFNLSATAIIGEFEKDSKLSNTKYLNKVIEVSGNIKTIENQTGFTIVLGDSANATSIRCSMDSSFNAGTTYKNGQAITIKGIYTGFNADDLGIGSDIIINKSIIKP